MQMPEVDDSTSEIPAIALGAIAGVFAGAGLGAMIVVLLGGVTDIGLIVLVHTIFAMMLMGAWCAPALLTRD